MSNTSNTGTHSNSYKIYNKNLDMKFLRKEIETEVGELSKKQELCSRKNTFFTCKFPSFQRSWSLPSIKRKKVLLMDEWDLTHIYLITTMYV